MWRYGYGRNKGAVGFTERFIGKNCVGGKKKATAIAKRNSPRITFPQKLLLDFLTEGAKSFMEFFFFKRL